MSLSLVTTSSLGIHRLPVDSSAHLSCVFLAYMSIVSHRDVVYVLLLVLYVAFKIIPTDVGRCKHFAAILSVVTGTDYCM